MFPYLSIAFRLPDKGGQAPHKKSVPPPSKTLGECRIASSKEDITITPDTTVHELFRAFYAVYGLSVSVQRKSGNAWLETSLTSGWTLQQQNKLGEELSRK